VTLVRVIGAGLAGSEAAWALAERGHDVELIEARPKASSPAHQTPHFAELVCSNSLGSFRPGTAKGLLMAELEACGSLIVRLAREHAVAAGGALAVDRAAFAEAVTVAVEAHERISVLHEVVEALPEGPAIVATGPLTLDALAADLAAQTGADHLHFYDATSPIVSGDSIDRAIVFSADRRGQGEGDYLNCPMDKAEYERFLAALTEASLVTPHGFEDASVFEGCMPIEQIARRGPETLRFGPMRPVGLTDPRTDRWPYAVVQMRREDAAGRMWNLVGFQTRMTHPAQRRVLQLIPGLESAEFLRFGVIHRNTYVDGPRALAGDLALLARPGVRLAGQLTGVEGYLESVAMGQLAARFTDAELAGRALSPPPPETMLGSLLRYVTEAEIAPIQPMNANFGLLPDPEQRLRKKERKLYYHERGLAALTPWLAASR
jgi:methylenetetrahydrofolate--tRNA-(uracil-5-)-methyltransferase